jgi:hypothetical protein
MYKYLHYIVDGWLNFKELNGTYEHNVLSQLISKALVQSRTALEITYFEITSRYLATYI